MNTERKQYATKARTQNTLDFIRGLTTESTNHIDDEAVQAMRIKIQEKKESNQQ